ncbi:hypothetical protein ACWGFX_38325 [Streptomyces xanthophaeus]
MILHQAKSLAVAGVFATAALTLAPTAYAADTSEQAPGVSSVLTQPSAQTRLYYVELEPGVTPAQRAEFLVQIEEHGGTVREVEGEILTVRLPEEAFEWVAGLSYVKTVTPVVFLP